MRMRLRAPDELDAESCNSFSGDSSTTLSTPDSSPLLPPLDVGSPEYIEERLENLKRHPKWRDFLDQYVREHSDSDSGDEESEYAFVSDSPTFMHSTLWSLLVAAFAPLLILCAPFLKHKSYGFWPLGCHSIKELFGCALVNVIFMLFGLVMLYWTICRELPDFYNLNDALVKINAKTDEVQSAAITCHLALLQWERLVAQELCVPLGIDAVLLLLNVWLLLHYHRRWAKYLMLLMAVIFLVDVPTRLYDATFPTPRISQIDPTFAMVDEELFVALDGVYLKPGGSVAWVAYWGCATTSNVEACDKQFISTFEAGIVAVTFRSLDHYIPCYRDPPNPLKAQDFQCFEDVRIRVKDTQSIPGWSRSVSQALSSRFVKTDPSPRDERHINATTLIYIQEKTVDHGKVKATDNIANSVGPAEAIIIDFSEELMSTLGNSGDYKSIEVKKGIPKMDSVTQMEVAIGSENNKKEADGIPREVKATSVTEENTAHADIETKKAPYPAVESLQDSDSKIDDFLDALKDVLVEVEVDKKLNQAAAVDKSKEVGHTNDAMQSVADAFVNEEVAVINVAVVLQKEKMQMVDESSKSPIGAKEGKRDVEFNLDEARLGETSTSAIIAQEEKLRSSDIKQKPSTEVGDNGIRLKPRDASFKVKTAEEKSKKKRNSKRKVIRPV